MSGTTSSTSKTTATPTPNAYRAFADFLAAGNTGTFDVWYASDAGQTALTAFADQAKAAAKSGRMADAKAVWRDFKNNGEVTIYSKAQAMRLGVYLASINFDAIQPVTAEATPAS